MAVHPVTDEVDGSAQILEYFPALERAFDYSTSKAAPVLLSRVAEGNLTPRLSQIGA
nr:hypothetical protein [Streptomyces sp. TLI_235]